MLTFLMLTSSALALWPSDQLAGPGAHATAAAVADLDADGNVDLLWASPDALTLQDNLAGPIGVAQVVATGGDWNALSLTDLDGDGVVDVVAGGTDLAIHIVAAGVVGPAQIVESSLGAYVAVAAADLDGDGDADLAAARVDGGELYLSWYANLGGSFGAAQSVATASGCVAAASALLAEDIDLDGDPDLMLASAVEPTCGAAEASVVWFDNAAGTFGVGTVVAQGWPAVGGIDRVDLDADGDRDLVVAAGDRVVVHHALGGGAFGAESLWTEGVEIEAVHSGDVDGDGVDDLVISDTASAVLASVPTGAGEALPWVALALPSSAALVVVDVDADGVPEVIAAGDAVHVHRRTDLDRDGLSDDEEAIWGTDPALWDTDGDGISDGAEALHGGSDPTQADTDGDGAPDDNDPCPLDAANLDSDGDGTCDAIDVCVGRGDGLAPWGPEHAVATLVDDTEDLESADFDGDGDTDLMVASGGAGGVLWLDNVDGVFDPPITVATTDVPNDVEAEDLDQDGDVDLVLATNSDDQVWFIDNLGGAWGAPQVLVTTAAAGPTDLVLADLDADGWTDVVFGTQYDLVVLPSLGSGTLGPAEWIATDTDVLFELEVLDLDGDGDLDLIASDWSGNQILAYDNLGAHAYGTSTELSTDPNPWGVTSADLADDGTLDLVSIISEDVMQIADGQGPFELLYSGTEHHLVAASDLDGDGDDDLVLAGSDGVAWLETNGTTPQVTELLPVWASAMTLADLDGDGDDDIIVSDELSLDVLWVPNQLNCAVDSDGDGLTDPEEVVLHGTDPQLADTDGDGLTDAEEIAAGSDPVDADSDRDGWPDAVDVCAGDATNPDADHDALCDDVDPCFGDHTTGDLDGDGVCDDSDACWGDDASGDTDGDLWCDDLDGCRFEVDPLQQDSDLDGTGDVCDPCLGYGDGLQPTSLLSVPHDDYVVTVLADDLDGDGDPDLVGSGVDWLSVFENLGDDVYAAAAPVTQAISRPVSLALGDFDLDGDLDLVTGSEVDAGVAWHANAGGVFGPPTVLGGGFDAAVRVADLDQDGDLDLLCSIDATFSATEEVGWFENLGGGFGALQIIAQQDDTYPLATSDLDGDGDLDVLVANDDEMMWMENLGLSFAAPVTLATPGGTIGDWVTADLDDDGDDDVAATLDSAVAVIENLGGATFGAAQRVYLPALGAPDNIVATDFDGDGAVDLVWSSRDERRASWQRNLGSWVFAPEVTLADDITARGLAVLDLASDGDNDVAIGVLDGVAVVSNQMECAAQDTDADGLSDASEILVWGTDPDDSDSDGDGLSDGDEVALGSDPSDTDTDDDGLTDDVDGCPTDPTNPDGDGDGVCDDSDACIGDDAVGDLDSDGVCEDLDVCVGLDTTGDQDADGICDDQDVCVGLSDPLQQDADGDGFGDLCDACVGWGDGARSVGPDIPVDLTDVSWDVALGDLDGDGDLDLVSAGRSGRSLFWYPIDAGHVGEPQTISGAAGDLEAVAVADLDGDGNIDVIAGGQGLTVHLNDGTAFEALSIDTDLEVDDVGSADLDGDGDLDLYGADRFANRVVWYEQRVDGFGPRQVVSSEMTWPEAIVAADLDADGDVDFAAVADWNAEVSWFENDGSGQWLRHILDETPNTAAGYTVEVVDVDADGFPDIVAAATSAGLVWYPNLAAGTFGGRTTLAVAGDPRVVRAADLDADGDLDLVVGGVAATRWLPNLGGTFGSEETVSESGEVWGLALGDVDGDGDPDPVLARDHPAGVVWLPNQLVCAPPLADTGDTGHTGSTGPTEVVGDTADTAPPTDNGRVGDTLDDDPEQGCGCASDGGASGWWSLVAMGLLGPYRRRSRTRV